MEPQPSAPPVVAVVVTCDPGPWFDEALLSLAAQDYPNLSVLVVDSASLVDPASRVAELLPSGFVQRLDQRVGFGRAANAVLQTVEGASHLLLCHDDVALAPDAVRLLVEEAFRSNAGVVSPKLVEWDRPDHLLAVGMGSDKFGVVHALVEPGEMDQEQHDGVRDVFVAPSGVTLVRADLFASVGGFDEAVEELGEDLDLSWRARLAGARVLVAPAARVRHLEAERSHARDGATTALAQRKVTTGREIHRLRTLVVCYGVLQLCRILPMAVLHRLSEAVWSLVRGRPGEAAATLGTLRRALSHPGALLRARRRAQKHRRVRDREIRRMQSRGSARLRAFVRAIVQEGPASGLPVAGLEPGATDPTARARAALRRLRGEREPGPESIVVAKGRWQLPLGAAIVLALLFVIGSRRLFAGNIPAIGQIPVTSDGVGDWWHAWLHSWQAAGLGQTAPGAPALGLLTLAGVVFLGAVGTLQHVLVLLPLVIGPLGAYRAARWWGSWRGRVVALVVYATVPVAYDALALGRWPAMVVYAAAPWVLGTLCRLSHGIPFPRTASRRIVGRTLGLGVGVAVTAAFAPSFIWVVPIVGIGLLLGSALAGRGQAGIRVLVVSVVAAAVGAVLLLPWSATVLGSRAATFGVAPGPAGRIGLGQLLRFDTGPVGSSLGWALLAAAALPLLIGRSWRLSWAARLWMVALVCIGVDWSGLRGWTPAFPPEILLAPAAAALAGAASLGAVAFELDLPGYRFGWRQLASGIAAVAIVVAAVPVLVGAGGGRWHLPDQDASSVLGLLPGPEGGAYRVLWVGAPSALPLASRSFGTGMAYATSANGQPDVTDQWLTARQGRSGLLAADMRLAQQHLTTKLGHLLGPLGVEYIVVPNHNGPSGSGAVVVPTPGSLLSGLQLQTDLRSVSPDPNYTVYFNAAWLPVRAVLSTTTAALAAQPATPDSIARALERLDGTGTGPILPGTGAGGRGRVPGGRSVYVAASADRGWRLHVDGQSIAPRSAFGWAMRFATPPGGSATATLTAPSSGLATAGQIGELVLWVLVLAVVAVDRRRRLATAASETVQPEWFVPLAVSGSRSDGRTGSRSGLSAGDADLSSDEVWIDV